MRVITTPRFACPVVLAVAALLFLPGGRAEAKDPQPEPARIDHGADLGATGVTVACNLERNGPGLDIIWFTAYATPGLRHLKVKLTTPEERTLRLSIEDAPFGGFPRVCYRIPPLSKAGRYSWEWSTDGYTSLTETIDYAPSYRLEFSEDGDYEPWSVRVGPGGNGTWLPDGGDVQPGPGKIWGPVLFTEDLPDHTSRTYEFRTFTGGRLTLDLPHLYRLRIGEESLVRVTETRDTLSAPLGYRYEVKVDSGKMTTTALSFTDPYGWCFRMAHSGRMPAELWTIWALEQVGELDKYALDDLTRDATMEVLKGWAAGNLVEFAGLQLDIPWQSNALSLAAAGAWTSEQYEPLLIDAHNFMEAHAVASAAKKHFSPSPSFLEGAPSGDRTFSSRDAAVHLFHMLRKGMLTEDPSLDRVMAAFEQAYILSWIYGDLRIYQHETESMLTYEQAPPDFFSFHDILVFKANPRSGTITTIGFKPKGTAWSTSVLSRHAGRKNGNDLWIANSDGTDEHRLASAPDGTVLGQVAFSQDGQRLAFTAYTRDSSYHPLRGELWTVKADGTDLRRLAQGDEPRSNVDGDANHPKTALLRDYFGAIDFSPDGTRVSAQRFRNYQDASSDLDWEDVEVVLVPVAGGDATRVERTRWVRYQPYDSLSDSRRDYALSYRSVSTAWSPRDELLYGRWYAYLPFATVLPTHGVADQTQFTFQAAFWDAYGKPPKDAKVVVGDREYALTFAKYLHAGVADWRDYAHGAIYSCSTTLPSSASGYTPRFLFTSWKGDEISVLPEMHPVRTFTLESVQATLTNRAEAEEWGNYVYEVTASFSDPSGSSDLPWLLVEAPSIGRVAYVMGSAGGTAYKKRFTLPLTWRPGETTTTDVKYWVMLPWPSAGLGPYTITVTRTWPDQVWKSTTGDVSVSSSVSGGTTYDAGGTTVTLSMHGEISATRGRSSDTFLFRARYSNSAGKPATLASVVIDGASHGMTLVGAEGAQSVYEYATALSAQAEKHRWGLKFSDGTGTAQTTLASQPWVADASLEAGSGSRGAGAHEYTFRVTARQTAGQGTCYLLLSTAAGQPRVLRLMDKVSGDLTSGATYELRDYSLDCASLYSKEGSCTTMHSIRSRVGLGDQPLVYRFLFVDGFAGKGSKLEEVLAGATTSDARLEFFDRGGSSTTPGVSNWREQVVLSTPGRASLNEDLFPNGSGRGEVRWNRDDRRFAMIGRGGTSLSVWKLGEDGQLRQLQSLSGDFASLSGWGPEGESLYLAKKVDGTWKYGTLLLQTGEFIPLAGTGRAAWWVDMNTFGGIPFDPWVAVSCPTRMDAVCTSGSVTAEVEGTGQGVSIGAGQKTRCDLAAGETAPATVEAVAWPYVTGGSAVGPSASSALYAGDSVYSSASVSLQPEDPEKASGTEGAGETPNATPTLSFGTSSEVTEESVKGMTLQVLDASGQAVLSGTLRQLESEGKVRVGVSGASFQVAPTSPLGKGSYQVRLSTAGLAGAGGTASNGDEVSGWFRVVEGLGSAGGSLSLSSSGVQVSVPAGALAAETAFDISLPSSLPGDLPAGCSLVRWPVAVAWSPAGELASPASLVFEMRASDVFAGTEPVIGRWVGGTWTLVDTVQSQGGQWLSTSLSTPGVFAAFQRARTAPDLTLAVGSDDSSVAPDQEVTFTLAAANRAGTGATGLVLRFAVPAGTEYVGGSATEGGSLDAASGQVVWQVASLGVTDRKEVSLRLRVTASAGSQFQGSATMTANEVQTPVAATSVVVRVLSTGTIAVSTNLDAARFTLTGGGTTFQGSGRSWSTDLVAPGSYAIEFSPVDGYLLPTEDKATKGVTIGATTRFTGAYRADSDGDAMADDWERQHFGSTDARAEDDPDHDGFTNLQEFLAGSDPRDASSRPSELTPGEMLGLEGRPLGVSGFNQSGFYDNPDPQQRNAYDAWEAGVIAEGGFGWNRTLEPGAGAFSWETVEPVRGQYNLLPADELVRACQEKAVRILAILTPYTPWDQTWQPGQKTTFPRDLAAYLAYVRAVVERYDGDGVGDMPGLRNGYRVRYWEVHNEPELCYVSAQAYLDVLRSTYETIKQADPGATVLNGGVAPPFAESRQFWLTLLDLGGGRYIDVFNVHDLVGNLAGTSAPSFVAPWRRELTSRGIPKTIWVTESGTYSGSVAADQTPDRQPWPEQSVRDQARIGVRRALELQAAGAKTVVWAMVDHFTNGGQAFVRACDLLYDRDHPKPVYYALQRLGLLLESTRTLTVEEAGPRSARLRLEGPYAKVYVIWSDAGGSLVLSGLSAAKVLRLGSVPGIDADGRPGFEDEVLTVTNGEVRVSASAEPVYVVVDAPAPAAVQADASPRFGCGFNTDVAFLAEMGMKWVRRPTDIDASRVNTRPIDFTALDARVLSAQQAGVHVFGIVNPRASNGVWPTAAEFAAYFGEVVERYDGDGASDMPGLQEPVKVWEICNEIQILPADDPRAQGPDFAWAGFTSAMYADYLRLCAEALLRANPSGRLANGSLTSVPQVAADDNLGDAVRAGVGGAVTASSFHDYVDGLHADMLQTYLAGLGLGDRPVYATETDMQGDHVTRAIGQEEGARRLVRSYVWGFAWGIDCFIYTEARETTEQPEFVRWGTLVDLQGNRRPSYHALKQLIAKVDGFTSVEPVTVAPGVQAFRFTVGTRQVYAVWSIVPQTVSLPFADARGFVTRSLASDASGTFATETLEAANGALTLHVGPTMAYVESWSDRVPPSAVANLSATVGRSGGESLPAWVASASSQVSGGFAAALVRDGDPTTGWQSLPVPTARQEYVVLDLGQWVEVQAIDLWPLTGSAAYFPPAFSLQSSRDGTVWTLIFSITGQTARDGTRKTYEFTPATARYLRVLCTGEARGADGYYRVGLGEVWAYSSVVEDPTKAKLTWASPRDEGPEGKAAAYDLRYAGPSLSEAGWSTATPGPGLSAPATAGQPESANVPGLTAGGAYALGLKSADAAGNVSALSNVATITLPTGLDTQAPQTIQDVRVEQRTLSGSGTRLTTTAATASTSYSANYDVTKAVDGDVSTAWSSAESRVFRPEYVTVDLGQAKLVGKVRLLPRSGFAALFPRGMRIEGSVDGTLWTTLAEWSGQGTEGQWTEVTFAGAVARYVRVLATAGAASAENGRFYVHLAEIEVHEATAQSATVAVLTWTSPYDPGSRSHRAARYRVLYSRQAITASGASVWAESDTPSPAAPGTGQMAVLRGLRPGKWYFAVVAVDAAGNASTASNSTSVVLPQPGVDFDGDGRADLAWFHPTRGTVALWLMNGTAAGRTVSLAGPGANSGWDLRGVGDFDGDGKQDLLWYHASRGTVAVWFMNGTGYTGQTATVGNIGASSGWEVGGGGDFDQDGSLDILWHHPTRGTVAIWFLSGSRYAGRSTTVGNIGASTGWKVGGLGDFDKDGNVDLVWLRPSQGAVALWMMSGSTYARTVSLTSLAANSGWGTGGVGDFDKDGNQDIVWYQPTQGTVSLWLMNGARWDGRRATVGSVGTNGGWWIGGGSR